MMTSNEWYKKLIAEIQKTGMPTVYPSMSSGEISNRTLEWFLECARRVNDDD